MLRFKYKRGLTALGVITASLGVAGTSQAFKPGTHIASANDAAGQLAAQITLDAQTNTLVFQVNGRRLDVQITDKEAFNAVRRWPDFYRAGVVGPDGFPDPLTGQFVMHGDQTPKLKDLVEGVTGVRPADHAMLEPFETRKGPSEFRSIDFATAMFQFLKSYAASSQEREQIIAFLVGYLSHGVGDGFAHTWVNEIAGGAWALEKGRGIWGSLSEEVKHVAIENYVDSMVPSSLLSTPGDGGGRGQVTLQAPIKFLDTFYAGRPANAGPIIGNPNGDFAEFAKYYGNMDQFHGGPFYSYFNAQVALAPAIKNWSRLGGFFDLAEDVRDNWFVNFALDSAELPAEIIQQLALNPVSWIDELTFGYVDCHVDNGGPNSVEKIREAIEFVGGVNDRIGKHSDKAAIVRRNWLKLSECSSQNLAKTQAADFDPTKPTLNTDACADVVRAGWEDEGNPKGLYRGNVRPGLAFDDEFLVELKAAFLGGDAAQLFLDVDDPASGNAEFHEDQTLESKNGHRSLRQNLSRELDYLVDFGFRGDELLEVLMPEKEMVNIKQTYNSFCSTVRDDAFENCLDLAFAPIAATGRQIKCTADHLQCTIDNAKTCLQNACMDGCPLSNSVCSDVCGTGETNSCENTCDDIFCLGPICEPVLHTICTTAVCGLLSSEKDTCAEAVLDEAVCGVKDVVCSFDNFVSTITLDNYAEELLTPARQACDTIDDALAFFECLRGDPAKTQEQQRADRRVCVIDRCAKLSTKTTAECTDMYDDLEDAYEQAERIKDAVSRAADALRNRPPHEFVNLAFLEEDLQNPAYLTQLRNAVNTARSNLTPPGPGAPPDQVALYQRRKNALDRWDALLTDVSSHTPTPRSLADFANAAEEGANLVADSLQLGLIPSVVGPTAQKILKDVGPSFQNTFLPFFNTVQGLKVAPMLGQSDVNRMFTSGGAGEGSTRLPWSDSTGAYSAACKDDAGASSVYCDALKSFDDPNCLDCAPALKQPTGPFGWTPGRGIVAYNKYDPANPVRFVTTNFTLANSESAYKNLYTRVFQVPEAVPGFGGFDDPAAPWTSTSGGLGTNTTNKTEGSGSLQLSRCGWTSLQSPRFRTTEWGVIGDRIQVDVFIPPEQANPYWKGDIMFFVTIPGANINNQPLQAWTSLTTLPAGWNTIEFIVSPAVKTALLGDFANAQFSINMNLASCTKPALIDNLRFAGNLTNRENYHLRGSQLHPVTTNPLFSFDTVGDWSSPAAISASPERVQGTASLAVNAANYTLITSRPFNTTELSGVTRNLSVDVWIPPNQPNIYWYGDVQVMFTCGPHHNRSLGMSTLTNRFTGEFNTVQFTIPDDVLATLRGNFANCRLDVALNVNPAGLIRLDNMGFY